MNIDYEYLSRIRRAVALYTNRKTSNILDGDFHSIHKGRSMEFDDLKEYNIGDDVHDIDWKSSSRMGTTLVRRYVTDRRHNVMFVCDCGRKMLGDTPKGESKKELALMTFGALAYITGRNGADFALSYPGDTNATLSIFKSGPEHLEALLYDYEKHVGVDGGVSLEQTLKNVVSVVHKKMIIVVIADMEGIASISGDVMRAITSEHDLLAIGIEDAMLTGGNTYDNDLGRYEKRFLSFNNKLHKLELEERERICDIASDNTKHSRVSLVSVSSQSEMIDSAIVLFERYRHGNYGYIKTTV
ncbi:DUF58 domain-containing protein [Butyrivibrio sp. X503]|uniref:DUF58 domain-containing protein n=1 Tax=Butyrivibrio sp. X503 TaxID=2364878 RepID=UPI000EAA39F0|nr:DUF58 domain-containing protein [Butyrivibrio sp. X503]RKM58121.1 DUF58 domain-containing protein [Butyrivibrio sp. X503]